MNILAYWDTYPAGRRDDGRGQGFGRAGSTGRTSGVKNPCWRHQGVEQAVGRVVTSLTSWGCNWQPFCPVPAWASAENGGWPGSHLILKCTTRNRMPCFRTVGQAIKDAGLDRRDWRPGLLIALLVGCQPPAAMAALAAAEDSPADGGAGVEDVEVPTPAARALQAAPAGRAGQRTRGARRSGRWRSGGRSVRLAGRLLALVHLSLTPLEF